MQSIIFDMDGTILQGETAIQGVNSLFEKISGVPWCIVSNTGTRDNIDMKKKMIKCGIRPPGIDVESRCLSAAMRMKNWLQNHTTDENVLYVGNAPNKRLILTMKNAILANYDTVIALFADGFGDLALNDMSHICIALSHGATLCIPSDDESNIINVEGRKHIVPGPGAILSAIRSTVKIAFEVKTFGKASDNGLFHDAILLLREQGFVGTTREVIVVGDRLDTDIRAGNISRMTTMLVESGCHSEKDIPKFATKDKPRYIAASVIELLELLNEKKKDCICSSLADHMSIGFLDSKSKRVRSAPNLREMSGENPS